jgi:hypothetical protein
VSENPYESPKGQRHVAPEVESPHVKKSSGRGVAIVLMVLSIPAALIAFGVVCSGTFVFSDLMGWGNTQNEVFIGAGAIGGGLVLWGMIWAARRMRKGK